MHGNSGKKRSQETLLKLRLSHLGQKAWNKGIPCRPETKRKLSEILKITKRQPCKEATKIKIGLANLGENNGQWIGDLVGYQGLHTWIKRHKPKPEYNLC